MIEQKTLFDTQHELFPSQQFTLGKPDKGKSRESQWTDRTPRNLPVSLLDKRQTKRAVSPSLFPKQRSAQQLLFDEYEE